MAEAKKDANKVSTLLGVSNADGVTPVVLWADPTTHRLLVSASSAITIGATVTSGVNGLPLYVAAGVLAQPSDPGADRIWFWDDSAGTMEWLTVGSGLTITGTTITSSGVPGGSDTHVQFNDGGAFGGDADFTWNKTTNIATITGSIVVNQSTLGSGVTTLTSTATNDDPTEILYQNRVATTDATVTTLHTFTVPTTTTYSIEAQVVARRTGGASGTAEDGARYKLSAVYKNVAGTATIIGSITSTEDEDQFGWNATFTLSGATVLCRVTGATGNNITWHMTARVYQLST